MAINPTRKISDDDIRISSGNTRPPGGQQVGSVTASVLVEHSCDISVKSGALRSQHQNKLLAMVVLAFAVDLVDHLERGSMSKDELLAIWKTRYGNTPYENENQDEETKNKA